MRFDVLPATPALLAEGEIVFEGNRRLSLAAFQLALSHHLHVQLRDGIQLRVATVPAIAVLKMASYLDRPDERENDLKDLARMLEAYLEDDDARRWDDAVIDAQIDVRDQSAFALGQDVARAAGQSHRPLVETFLQRLEAGVALGQMAQSIGFVGEDRGAVLQLRLAAFRLGLGWE